MPHGKIVLFCILTSCLVKVFVAVQVTEEFTDEDVFLQNKYKEMDAALKSLTERSYKFLLPHLLEASEIMNLSAPCMANLLSIGLGVRNLKKWAIEFLDATGKINEGMLHYNPHILGNFDQCLAASSKSKIGKMDFSGRYCLIQYSPYLPHHSKSSDTHISLKRTYANTRNLSELLQYAIVKLQEGDRYMNYYGLCVPSGCSFTDVDSMFKYVGKFTYMNFTVQYCQVESEASYLTTRKIVIICIFAFFGLLGIFSSAVEYCYKLKIIEFKGLGAEIIRCFSITTNFPKLLSTKSDTEVLSCIAGIRVLSVFYITLVHKFFVLNSINFTSNFLPNMAAYIPTFFYQIILNSYLCIEVFFFISGFLNAYMRMKLVKKGKTFIWWNLLIHRLWRIYPAYIITILFLYLLTPRGPLGPYFVKHYIEDCNTEWWKNMIFINNFYTESKCLLHTWYIACDMQYFLLSLVTIPILIKNPKQGILLNAVLVLCGLLVTTLWIFIKNMAPSIIFDASMPGGKEEILEPYESPISHVSTYCLGILMGYFVSKKETIRISRVHQAIGWIVATFLFTSMLFMTYRWHNGIQYTPAESALYFAFSKPLYALAVGWLLLCCISGHGGVINYILSLKLWIPLSRLTFTIYLLSLPLQLFYMTNRRRAADTQWMIWIWEYVADVCVSCLLALSISLLMESPVIALEKLLFKGKDKDKDKKIESLGNTPMKEVILQENKAQKDSIAKNNNS